MIRAILVGTFLAVLLCSGLAPAQKQAGKKYALLVGVNDYDHRDLATLKYAEDDVERLAGILEANGFEVRLLSGKAGKTVAKDAPTAANVKEALRKVMESKTRHDTLLIALSGHGVQLEVQDPEDKGKPKTCAYFCPADADFSGISYSTGRHEKLILLDDLFHELRQCGAGSRLVLMDACRNETKAGGATRSMDTTRVSLPVGVAALFSCAPGEKAWESKKVEHGVFFYFVLEALRGKAKNKGGMVTWEALVPYVRQGVSDQIGELVGGGARQNPHSMGSLTFDPVLVHGKEGPEVDPDAPGKDARRALADVKPGTKHGPGDVKVVKDGWVQLFDGKTLDGWELQADNQRDAWRVENGELVGSSEKASHLFSTSEWDDFHLRVEAKINDRGNSGVFFRSQKGNRFPHGYEAQVNVSGDKVKTGSLYVSPRFTAIPARSPTEAPHRADEWFTLEVICKGPQITLAVDGNRTLNWTDPKGTYTRGRFALQVHDDRTEVRFRKIEVRKPK